MPNIEEILTVAKEAGASDVHLTVGIPPKMRVNGNLITMEFPKLVPADTLEMVLSIGSARLSSMMQPSSGFTAAVTSLSDFRTQEEEICYCFHLFPFYLP